MHFPYMCPKREDWHVEQNKQDYWRVKISVTNFNFNMKYTQWNLVVDHPDFDNTTKLVGLNYKPLFPYGSDISKLISAPL
jgi:hypothetical protein